MWTHVVKTHICLCQCECSHLEPLCIHTCAHKYTYIPSQILLYMNPCCASWHVFVTCTLASAHAWNVIVYTGLYIHILTSIHISRIISRIRWYINLCCALSHLFVPLWVLTLRTSLYTYWQDYINHITDSFVYEPMLCLLTYVYALARAHT